MARDSGSPRQVLPVGPRRVFAPRVVAVVPAYNEAATVLDVLERLWPRVDHLIVVDDGSTDGTGELVDGWAAGRGRCTVLRLEVNAGKSVALHAAWATLADLCRAHEVDSDDVVVTVDADGQHDPADIERLVRRLGETGSDAVIARRDLSYHRAYKRLGNAALSLLAGLCAGTSFHDIESGFRAYRIGALLAAEPYYRGHRYSGEVEVAIVLARLGFLVDNSLPIAVPVSRTRTRLSDATSHALVMPITWYRVQAWRGSDPSARSISGALVSAVVLVAFGTMLALMLLHRFYLGDDSAQSYAHVWYLQRALFQQHAWPWHVATLEAGRAVMFPYALLPWLPTALVYPVFGDWAVTASIVLGVALLLGGIWYWLPATRHPVITALLLLNPELWGGIAQFQLATIWAFACAAFAMGLLDRRHRRAGLLAACLAIVAHPVMGSLALLCGVVVRATETRSLPWRRITLLALAAALASPAVLLFLSTPLLHETSSFVVARSAVINTLRVSVLALPVVLSRTRNLVLSRQNGLLAIGIAAVALTFLREPPSGLWERSKPPFAEYLASRGGASGPVRVLVTTNHEDGMVQLMRANVVLAQEFFDESVERRSFGSVDAYTCLLAQKHATEVLVSPEYERRVHTDEVRLLRDLTDDGRARLVFQGANGTTAYALEPGALPADSCGGTLRNTSALPVPTIDWLQNVAARARTMTPRRTK